MPMFSIYDLINGAPPTLRIIDVGAMYLGPDADSFDTLLKKGRVSIVGFEPLQSECDKLNAIHGSARVYFPCAIGVGMFFGFAG